MAKLFVFFAIAFAFVAIVSAQGGVKDILGNYYDFSTGQYSSALTGRVYNTVPRLAAPLVAAPLIAPVAHAHYAAPIAAAHYHAHLAPAAPLIL